MNHILRLYFDLMMKNKLLYHPPSEHFCVHIILTSFGTTFSNIKTLKVSVVCELSDTNK